MEDTLTREILQGSVVIQNTLSIIDGQFPAKKLVITMDILSRQLCTSCT